MSKLNAIMATGCIILLAGCVTEGSPKMVRTPASMVQAAAINIELGFDHLRNGRRADAVTKFERAIEEDPENPRGYVGLAMINEQAGDLKEARRRYAQAVDHGATDASIHNVYGAFLCKTGDIKRAEEEFMIAAKTIKYDTPEVAFANAGICLKRAKQDARAEELLRAAIKEEPNYGPALFELADLALAHGDALHSRAFLQRLLELGRPDARTLLLAWRTELAMNDTRSAQRYADQLKRDFPDSDQAKELSKK